MLKKALAAGTIALTLAGASIAMAQDAQHAQQTPVREMRGWQPSAEDAAALTDARIAALKAGLKLTPDQEKNWPAVETAIRDLAKQRADRMKEHADERKTRREARRSGGDAATSPDMIARLRHRADAMNARAESLKKLSDAAEPLYKSLDDGQKHRFARLLHAGRRAGGHSHHHWMHRAENAR